MMTAIESQEQREALIKYAKGYLSAAEVYVENHPNDKSGVAHRDLLSIALAALEAEPVGYHSCNARAVFRVWPTPDGDINVPVYSAPPVPVAADTINPVTD